MTTSNDYHSLDSATQAILSLSTLAASQPRLPITSPRTRRSHDSPSSQPSTTTAPSSSTRRRNIRRRDEMEESPQVSSKKVKQQKPVSPKENPNTKGLRHFSIQVCQKLQELHAQSLLDKRPINITYNMIADLLVAENRPKPGETTKDFDEKNIRRRIYDALNVLMAMQIISKERKLIRWNGIASANLNHIQQDTYVGGRVIKSEQRLLLERKLAIKQQQLMALTQQFLIIHQLIAHHQRKLIKDTTTVKCQLPILGVTCTTDVPMLYRSNTPVHALTIESKQPLPVYQQDDVLRFIGTQYEQSTLAIHATHLPPDIRLWLQTHVPHLVTRIQPASPPLPDPRSQPQPALVERARNILMASPKSTPTKKLRSIDIPLVLSTPVSSTSTETPPTASVLHGTLRRHHSGLGWVARRHSILHSTPGVLRSSSSGSIMSIPNASTPTTSTSSTPRHGHSANIASKLLARATTQQIVRSHSERIPLEEMNPNIIHTHTSSKTSTMTRSFSTPHRMMNETTTSTCVMDMMTSASQPTQESQDTSSGSDTDTEMEGLEGCFSPPVPKISTQPMSSHLLLSSSSQASSVAVSISTSPASISQHTIHTLSPSDVSSAATPTSPHHHARVGMDKIVSPDSAPRRLLPSFSTASPDPVAAAAAVAAAFASPLPPAEY